MSDQELLDAAYSDLAEMAAHLSQARDPLECEALGVSILAARDRLFGMQAQSQVDAILRLCLGEDRRAYRQ